MSFTQTMPKLSPTMEMGIIAKWHKKEGDLVEPGELLLEVSTDKATVEFNAIDGGYLRKILIPEGGEAAVNEPIALFTATLEEIVKGKESTRLKASPLAKKLAQAEGIDLSQVQGSGPGGRIVSRDLKIVKVEKKEGEESLTPFRKVIASRLQEAKQTIPHFYVTMEVDGGPLVELREQLSNFEHKVSFNDLIVKATAMALLKHPDINSGYHNKNHTLIRFSSIDISVAVQVESGLITPIVKNADQKSVEEIAKEIRTLAKKAKEGKLQPLEFQGGSFTVSNLGMYGVSQFTAIINPPQAAILAVGGLLDRPLVKQGQLVAGKSLALTLSVDHRVIDGVAASLFLQTLRSILENPASLILKSL